jgi:diacylglycerol kinase family enzyme
VAVRAVLVSNPKSYRGPYPVERFAPILAAAGWTVRVVERMPGADVHRLLAPVIEAGAADVILAAGGDGTARDVAAEVAGTGIPGHLAGGSRTWWPARWGMLRSLRRQPGALAATARPSTWAG